MTRPLSISFEFFPPKTAEGRSNLIQAAADLSHVAPYFFSVTFGAGGSTQEGTLESALTLHQSTQVPIAPHLACMGMTRNALSNIIEQYQAHDIHRIVALRGDRPSGMVNTGELHYASDLISLIRQTEKKPFHIEVAAYPEIHPQAHSPQDDVINLKRKYEAGANSAITQYFFNADAYFYYLEECAVQGVNFPIVPGIMPITQFMRLARFSDLCGAEIPRWIRKRLESYGDDLPSIRAFGQEVVYSLCRRLIEGGAPGLHFYTLNQATACLSVLSALGIDGGLDRVQSPATTLDKIVDTTLSLS